MPLVLSLVFVVFAFLCVYSGRALVNGQSTDEGKHDSARPDALSDVALLKKDLLKRR
jgi:hypothetical protein